MKKRILSTVVLVLVLAMCLCGCGDSAKDSKGTRNDPYGMGETICFTADYEGTDIEVELTVNDLIKGSETIEKMYNDNDIYPQSGVEELLIEFTISCKGDYDSDIYLENLVDPILITDSMEEDAVRGNISDKNLDGLTTIYTGVEYQLYKSSDIFGNFSADEYKYVRFEFENSKGEDTDIWVELK
ncbi:MAG: hypothetical protein IJD19_01860 [Ruminococcus sp.]|nr:hypothetical protein [Ruminococcus sp.]